MTTSEYIQLGILIGIWISILVALFGPECREKKKRKKRLKQLKEICEIYFEQLKKDLEKIKPNGNNASFTQTNINELKIHKILYLDILLKQIELINSIPKTIEFFVHYHIQLNNLEIRFETTVGETASLTLGTFNDLCRRFKDAIKETET